jgi:hypothetical protein
MSCIVSDLDSLNPDPGFLGSGSSFRFLMTKNFIVENKSSKFLIFHMYFSYAS